MNNSKVKHLKSLSVLLDSQFDGPFGFRFGLDGLLGLIPVVGDLATTIASVYIISQCAALGCTPATLIRMAMNVIIENVVDMIPFLGHVFDFYWKANNKNIALLESHLVNPKAVSFQSRLILIILCLLLLGILVASGFITFWVVEAVVKWMQQGDMLTLAD
jgi:hypothetical protein